MLAVGLPPLPGYDVFAPFYDAVMGDGGIEHADYVRSLLDAYHPEARTLLELGCGTGAVLAGLRERYDVVGLDVEPAMLAVAERKLAGIELVEGDMRSCALGRTFDVVLCVFDSINHLLTFDEWERTFACAAAHLAAGGVFVFDVNTPRRLEALAARPAFTRWCTDSELVVMDVERRDDGAYDWRVDVFARSDDGRFTLHEATFREAAFPRADIVAGLRPLFARVAVHDAERERPSPASDRLHFVARGARNAES